MIQTLDQITFAFLDVETTGLSPRYGDRICEIAIVRARLDRIQKKFQSLVNPERSISPGASAVNGISDDDVIGAPRFAEVAGAVVDALSDAVIVCHNASFDLGFVASEMQHAGYSFKPGIVIDTLAIARNCFRFSSNSLSNIARALAIPTPNAHRAMGDVLATRGVLRRFVDELSGRGVQTLDDLVAAQGSVRFAPIMTAAGDVPLPPEIGEALSSGKRLFLKYLDAGGRKSERWVTPHQVTGLGNILYHVAFCHLREEKRNFRLDRIVEMRLE